MGFRLPPNFSRTIFEAVCMARALALVEAGDADAVLNIADFRLCQAPQA